MAPANSLLVQLFENAETKGEHSALIVKEAGEFRSYTWRQIARDVVATAEALAKEGIGTGDRVVQISENRYGWLLVDFALQSLRAVHVPLHTTLSGRQMVTLLKHCEARAIIVSGQAVAEKFAEQADEKTRDCQFFSHDPCQAVVLDQAVRPLILSDSSTCAEPSLGSQEELATILYTSGTLGEPKGVALTAGNFVANAQSILAAFGANPNELRLNFLPLSHIFARTCDLYVWVFEGSRMALAESTETVIRDCRPLAPTMLNGVPYFFDKVYRGLCQQGLEEIPGSLKNMLGGNLRMCISGGAALPESLQAAFQKQGVPLLQGYGLTEAAPVVSACTLAANRSGTAGKPLPGVEVVIASDGEILVRGNNVMSGYYKEAQATADVLQERWLCTGDIGEVDEDGYLKVLGRKKEILVTAGGKNIAPSLVESWLLQHPLIAQAMVVGNDQKYLAALIVPNMEMLRQRLFIEDKMPDPPADLLGFEEVKAVYRATIDHCLKDAADFEQIAKFVLLPRPFSMALGEMTSKLSLRREQIAANFATEIRSLFDPAS